MAEFTGPASQFLDDALDAGAERVDEPVRAILEKIHHLLPVLRVVNVGNRLEGIDSVLVILGDPFDGHTEVLVNSFALFEKAFIDSVAQFATRKLEKDANAFVGIPTIQPYPGTGAGGHLQGEESLGIGLGMRNSGIVQSKPRAEFIPESQEVDLQFVQLAIIVVFSVLAHIDALGGDADHGAFHDQRLRKHARLHQQATVRQQVNGHLSEPERELERSVALQKIRDHGHALANPIAADKEQKTPLAKAARDFIDEVGFVKLRGGLVHDVEKCIAAPTGAAGHGALYIVVRPSAEFLCIVQDLTDDGSARFGVAPELGFEHHQPALGRGVERIDGSGRCVQLRAHGHGAGIGAVDFLDGQRLGMAEQQLLQPRLVVIRRGPVGGKGNFLQRLRLAAGRGSGWVR